jgi:CBS domain-containing protein
LPVADARPTVDQSNKETVMASNRKTSKTAHRPDGRAGTTVADLMTADPACCDRDTPLPEVARMMIEHDCGAIPVVDDDGRPIGMITDRDLTCRAVARDLDPAGLTAADCMTSDCVTIEMTASAKDCLDLLERNQIRRAIVVDDHGRCCGIVAQADVARRSEAMAGELVARVSEPLYGLPAAM